jgi:hypothetical protein
MTPSMTPTPSPPSNFACVEPVNVTLPYIELCCGYDALLREGVYTDNHDGYSDKLRFFTQVAINVNVYYINGATLSGNLERYLNTYSLRGLSPQNLVLSYGGGCSTLGDNIIWGIPGAVGAFVDSPFLYSASSNNVDLINDNNSVVWMSYNIAQTNIANGAPLSVGSQLYLAFITNRGGIAYQNASGGYYLLPNGNKYVVNSSGVVTSIETNIVTFRDVSNVSSENFAVADRVFVKLQNTRNSIYANQPLKTVYQLQSVMINVNLVVGNCYKFIGQNGYTITGRLYSKTSLGNNVYNIRLTDWGCNT